MARDSFIVYRSFYDLIDLLNDKEQLILFRAMFDYSLDGIEPAFSDKRLRAVWGSIFPQLKANNKRYENGCKAKCVAEDTPSEIPSEGANATPKPTPSGRAKPTPSEIPSEGANATPNENENVNEDIIAAKLNNNILNKNGGASAYACEADENVQNSLANYRFIAQQTSQYYNFPGFSEDIVDRVLDALHANGYAYDLKIISGDLFGSLITRVMQTNPHNINAYVKKIVEDEIGRND